VNPADQVVVQEKTAFPKIAAIYAKTPVETLQAWQAFNLVDQAAPYLSKTFDKAHYEFRSAVLNGRGVSFYFGGTSLLIVVGVAMDTVTQIEAQLIMRHYDGFTPKSGRIRGRRTW